MRTINSENITLRGFNGELITQSESLQLKVSELKSSFPKAAAEIKNLKVKVGRARFYSQTSSSNNKEISVRLDDSLNLDSTISKTFHYTDAFYSVNGFCIGDSAHLQIQSRDTLLQVIYKGDRIKPWLWFFSKRKIMQRVSLINPNAKIGFTQLLQIQRGNKFKL